MATAAVGTSAQGKSRPDGRLSPHLRLKVVTPFRLLYLQGRGYTLPMTVRRYINRLLDLCGARE
jgi:hypothetical protein